MTARSRIGRFYARRNRFGEFRDFSLVGNRQDRRVKARTIVKSGYGDKGDLAHIDKHLKKSIGMRK